MTEDPITALVNAEPDGGAFDHIREPNKRRFLRAVVITGGNKSRAAALAGVDPSTPYTAQWREDESFQRALEVAMDAAGDILEAEATRRAVDGVVEPVGWHRGEPGGYVTRYSDTLLIFLLKGARPTKYMDRHVHTSPDGGPVEFNVTHRVVDPSPPALPEDTDAD